MKGLVAYNSVYGNTKQVARAIAEQIRADGHSAELLNFGREKVGSIEADFMFIGSPTRMKGMSRATKHFIKKLDKGHWNTKSIVAFDTYGPLPKPEEEGKKAEKWLNPGAAGEIKELAEKMGLKTHPLALRCAVLDLKGPLEPDAPEKAKRFTHEFIGSLGK